MIQPEHITLFPWAQMIASFTPLSKSLKEYFDDGDGTSAEERVLARCSKQLILVFFDERRVKDTVLELFDGKCASKEFDICG